jgi:hypothetical protein
VPPEHQEPAGTYSSHDERAFMQLFTVHGSDGADAGAGAEHAGALACPAPPWDVMQWCDALLIDVHTGMSHGDDAVVCQRCRGVSRGVGCAPPRVLALDAHSQGCASRHAAIHGYNRACRQRARGHACL